MKRLLAILGSPHPDGSAAAMLACAAGAAREAGWEVDLVSLCDKRLQYCRGCRACLATGRCVITDDQQEIENLLKNCDAVALAAPTYWANVPAVVKNLFDRLLGAAMEETATFPKPRFKPSQKYLLLTACNTPAPFSWLCGQSRGSLRAMDEFFKTSGMKCMGKVVFSGARGRRELPKSVVRRIQGAWK